MLSDENVKKLRHFTCLDDCITWLYLEGEKDAARALNALGLAMVSSDNARNLGTYAGFASDVRCPHYEGPITNDPPTTNDCVHCHKARRKENCQ